MEKKKIIVDTWQCEHVQNSASFPVEIMLGETGCWLKKRKNII